MIESVRFDLQGQIRIDFHDQFLIHHALGVARIRLPNAIAGRKIITNRPLEYQVVQWIGVIRRHQWPLLFFGIPFSLLGVVWWITYWGNWKVFGPSVAVSLLLGPGLIALFLQGRPHLCIASDEAAIVIPMDRHKRKIARILGLLSQHCNTIGLRWVLDGTRFADRARWDTRAKVESSFNFAWPFLISWTLLTLAVGRILRDHSGTQLWARWVMFGMLVAGGVAAIEIWRRSRRKLSRNAIESSGPPRPPPLPL